MSLRDIKPSTNSAGPAETRSIATSSPVAWKLSIEYLQMDNDEQAAWSLHGGFKWAVNFFVAPSGQLKATLPMHLHCPSFYIADLRSEEHFDESSPSTKQLQSIGFSTENALFFFTIYTGGKSIAEAQ